MLKPRVYRPPCRIDRVVITAAALSVVACASSIAPFSSIAFEQATSLKVEALAVMTKATARFDSNKAAVEELKTNLDKAHEFAKNRPKNEYSTQQWAKIKDPDSNLLGGFLKRWEQQSVLSRVFVDEAKRLVSDAFDEIIGLETGKRKPAP